MRQTGQSAVLQIETDAAVYGCRRSHDANGRPRYEITCGECGKEDGVFNASFQHAEDILSHFRRKGWSFERRSSPYCSTQCKRAAKLKQAQDRKEEEMKHPQTNIQPPPLPAAPIAHTPIPASIGPNPKIARRVITLLNEHFDVDRRLYQIGWSDERVAKEGEAAIDFVIKYRDDAYAKLAEDPEATKLRADIKALDELQAQYSVEINGKLDDLRVRLDKFTGVHHKAQG